MNLQQYKEQRLKLLQDQNQHRDFCLKCRQPGFGCYCSQIQPVECPIEFVILIHSLEARRRIATGRMAHLSLPNSHLITGCDYTHNNQVNSLISDPQRHCMILYPGIQSTNLSHISNSEKKMLSPHSKKLTVFVIDGTWATARKMVRLSQNLHDLQRICFSPRKPSNFRVRKQPKAECYSTIEAIHETIELLGEAKGFSITDRKHDHLLHVFDWMVERQIEFIEKSRSQGPSRYRREREKRSQQTAV